MPVGNCHTKSYSREWVTLYLIKFRFDVFGDHSNVEESVTVDIFTVEDAQVAVR